MRRNARQMCFAFARLGSPPILPDRLHMLGNLLIQFRQKCPDFPGRNRLLHALDGVFGPFTATTADGVQLRVYTASFMDGLYFERGAEAAGDKRILEEQLAKLEPGDVFVDIGANIGFYSILAGRRVGPGGLVLAFEPSRREFARLLANLELNRSSNVVPFSLALGARPGFLELHLGATHTGLNTLQVSASAAHGFAGKTQSVCVATFDALLPEALGERRIRLLKIDVEGAEFDVLSGMAASLRHRVFDAILVEITPDFLKQFGHTKEELYSLLEGCGYRPKYRLETWQYDELFERT